MLTDFDEAVEYLSSVIKNQRCPQCGESAPWSLEYLFNSNTRDKISGLLTLTGAALPENPNNLTVASSYMHGRPVLPLVCTNCGFMKIFDYTLINKKIAERKSQVTNEQPDVGPSPRTESQEDESSNE